MAEKRQTSMRLGEELEALLDAWAKYLNPERPSRATAVHYLARHVAPPTELESRAQRVRILHRELMK